MSMHISNLEHEWLHAETLADKARYEVEACEARRKLVRDEIELRILASNIEMAKARQAKADRAAAETFDRLWEARHGHAA